MCESGEGEDSQYKEVEYPLAAQSCFAHGPGRTSCTPARLKRLAPLLASPA